MADMDSATSEITCLKPMLVVHAAALSAALVGTFIPQVFFIAGALAILTAGLMTFAVWMEAGRGYAVGHLLLLVLLTPVFLIGPIAVPLLVWSDLAKRRTAANSGRASAAIEAS